MKVFDALLYDAAEGRLTRAQFGSCILVAVSSFAIIMLVIWMVGEILTGAASSSEAEKGRLTSAFAYPFYVALLPILLFMALNIMAKRFRDMGLYGWGTLLVVLALAGLATIRLSLPAGITVVVLGTLPCFLVPSDLLRQD